MVGPYKYNTDFYLTAVYFTVLNIQTAVPIPPHFNPNISTGEC